jgi:hypothetical protein
MVGSSTNPINLNLPWSDSLSEHVSVHEKIITGTMDRNGTPNTRNSSRVHPWKIGDRFKETDLAKSTPFPKAYLLFPPTEKCSSEAVKLESEPLDQPFEHVDSQGVPTGSPIALSQGRISWSESALVAQEKLVQRLIGCINSIDTLLKFAVSQQEHLSSDSMLEVLRHARFDVAASSSYAWRTSHNIRLMRRQAAIDVLHGSITHPPMTASNKFVVSLFGGKLADIHQKLVQNLQVRPILVGPQGARQSGTNRSDQNFESKSFRKPLVKVFRRKAVLKNVNSPLFKGHLIRNKPPLGLLLN